MKKILIAMMIVVLSVSSAFAQQKWPSKITYSAVPTSAQHNMKDMLEPLQKHLEKELGIEVEMKASNDYNAAITGMQYNHIDCVYFGPKSYVEASKRANAEALVLEKALDGTLGYYGWIITKKGSGLKSLEDIKGKKWAFTDPNSTSGTLVPSVMFAKANIDPKKYFDRVIYSGSHAASIMSVNNGKVDAASTNDLDFLRGVAKKQWKKEDFNILWVSDLIPAAPTACRSGLPSSLRMAIKGALVSFDSKEGLDRLKISGYIPVKDSFYDSVRELVALKKKLKNKK